MLHTLGEMLAFLRAKRKFWLIPIVIMLLAFGVLLLAAQGSALAPFIYALF